MFPLILLHHLKDNYKKLNPKTLIPTLVVNNKPIPESIDIMKFIDNEHPNLDRSDIKTEEILDWKGIHLFHFSGSACSQKLRIFFNIKKINFFLNIIFIRKS